MRNDHEKSSSDAMDLHLPFGGWLGVDQESRGKGRNRRRHQGRSFSRHLMRGARWTQVRLSRTTRRRPKNIFFDIAPMMGGVGKGFPKALRRLQELSTAFRMSQRSI